MNDRRQFLKNISLYLPQESWVVEIGVLEGDFSQMILEVINPYRLILIDPFEQSESTYNEGMNGLSTAYSTPKQYRKVTKRFEKQMLSGQVSAIKNYSYNAVNGFPDEAFDLVYLDGCHTYDCVKKDLSDWIPKLKPDGIISGHDYIKHESFGVIQAVNELVNSSNWTWLLKSGDGDWALKR